MPPAYSMAELRELGTLYSYNDLVGVRSDGRYLWYQYCFGLGGYIRSGSTLELPQGSHKIRRGQCVSYRLS